MWTPALIARLKKYIDGSRYFQVYYQTHKVYGMDLVPDQYAEEFPPDSAEFYLEEYDDARPDGVTLSETEPTDFQVYLLKPVDWQANDPDWSEADPETWATYKEWKDKQ